jgi:hypothetical protein
LSHVSKNARRGAPTIGKLPMYPGHPPMNSEAEQVALCQCYGREFVPASPDSKTGLAIQTLGNVPLHGLRHPPTKETSGWYIWGGSLSADAGFFSPIHTSHVADRVPEVVKFLGLPPGSRFLLAGEHVDVWFDESLLNV